MPKTQRIKTTIYHRGDISNTMRQYSNTKTIFLEKRHEVHTAVPTWQKSVDILGFEHKTSLEDGLAKMWQWAKAQPMRERFVWENYEIEKGIYSFWKNKK